MEKGWENIYNTSDEYLSSMAKDILLESGIESVVINHKDSAYVFWGEYEIFVRDEVKEEATKIIEQIKKGLN